MSRLLFHSILLPAALHARRVAVSVVPQGGGGRRPLLHELNQMWETTSSDEDASVQQRPPQRPSLSLEALPPGDGAGVSPRPDKIEKNEDGTPNEWGESKLLNLGGLDALKARWKKASEDSSSSAKREEASVTRHQVSDKGNDGRTSEKKQEKKKTAAKKPRVFTFEVIDSETGELVDMSQTPNKRGGYVTPLTFAKARQRAEERAVLDASNAVQIDGNLFTPTRGAEVAAEKETTRAEEQQEEIKMFEKQQALSFQHQLAASNPNKTGAKDEGATKSISDEAAALRQRQERDRAAEAAADAAAPRFRMSSKVGALRQAVQAVQLRK